MSGRIAVGDAIRSLNYDDKGDVVARGSASIVKLLTRRGIDQIALDSAEAGDIVGVAGLDRLANVTDTYVTLCILLLLLFYFDDRFDDNDCGL